MTRSSMKYLSVLRIVLLAILWANAALAEPSDPTARREAYRTGYAAIEKRDWAEAQRIFDVLWQEERAYDVALHLGQAEFQLGRYRDAAEHLAFGVAHMPPGESEELRERGILALERARSKVGTLEIVVNRPSAEVHIDGVLIGSAPIEGERFVVHGRHRVEASLAGYAPKSLVVEIRAGEAQELAFELVPLPASSPAPAHSLSTKGSDSSATVRSSGSSGLETREMVLLGGAALTAIAGVTTVVFALKSSSAGDREDDLRTQASTHGANPCASSTAPGVCTELDDAVDERIAASQIAYVSLGVTGVSAIATAIVYFTWPEEKTDVAFRPKILPLLSPNSSGLYVTGSF
jgi:hypothetical protein